MRGLVVAGAFATLCACGRLSFDGQSRDASADVIEIDDVGIDTRPPAPPCGTSIHFKDELDDTTAAPLFTGNTDPGVALTEELGHLDVNFIAGGAAAMSSAFYVSVASYPTAELCVVLDFTLIPTNGAEIFFELFNPQREIVFDANPATLYLVTTLATVRDQQMTLPRDPSIHFWRLRNQNQTIHWDVSADGVTFDELWSLPGFIPAGETMQLLFGAGTGLAPTTDVDVARFESIRATGP